MAGKCMKNQVLNSTEALSCMCCFYLLLGRDTIETILCIISCRNAKRWLSHGVTEISSTSIYCLGKGIRVQNILVLALVAPQHRYAWRTTPAFSAWYTELIKVRCNIVLNYCDSESLHDLLHLILKWFRDNKFILHFTVTIIGRTSGVILIMNEMGAIQYDLYHPSWQSPSSVKHIWCLINRNFKSRYLG